MLMCGVGAKSVAHLIKFHLLQWEVEKVKFLMNSNMTLTVLNLHQKTNPKVQQDFQGSRSLRQAQRSNQGQTMMMHTYTSQPMSLPSINFLHCMVSEI